MGIKAPRMAHTTALFSGEADVFLILCEISMYYYIMHMYILL